MVAKEDYLKIHTIEEWNDYVKLHSKNKFRLIEIYGEEWYRDLLERNREGYRNKSLDERKELNKLQYQKNKKKWENETSEEHEKRLKRDREKRKKSYYKNFEKNKEKERERSKIYNEQQKQNNPERWRKKKRKAVEKWEKTHREHYLQLKRKNQAKRKGRGFLPLTKSLNVEFDWHHISKELPYLIAVPRKLHQSIAGSLPTHYSSVNGFWLIGIGRKEIESEIV